MQLLNSFILSFLLISIGCARSGIKVGMSNNSSDRSASGDNASLDDKPGNRPGNDGEQIPGYEDGGVPILVNGFNLDVLKYLSVTKGKKVTTYIAVVRYIDGAPHRVIVKNIADIVWMLDPSVADIFSCGPPANDSELDWVCTADLDKLGLGKLLIMTVSKGNQKFAQGQELIGGVKEIALYPAPSGNSNTAPGEIKSPTGVFTTLTNSDASHVFLLNPHDSVTTVLNLALDTDKPFIMNSGDIHSSRLNLATWNEDRILASYWGGQSQIVGEFNPAATQGAAGSPSTQWTQMAAIDIGGGVQSAAPVVAQSSEKGHVQMVTYGTVLNNGNLVTAIRQIWFSAGNHSVSDPKVFETQGSAASGATSYEFGSDQQINRGGILFSPAISAGKTLIAKCIQDVERKCSWTFIQPTLPAEFQTRKKFLWIPVGEDEILLWGGEQPYTNPVRIFGDGFRYNVRTGETTYVPESGNDQLGGKMATPHGFAINENTVLIYGDSTYVSEPGRPSQVINEQPFVLNLNTLTYEAIEGSITEADAFARFGTFVSKGNNYIIGSYQTFAAESGLPKYHTRLFQFVKYPEL